MTYTQAVLSIYVTCHMIHSEHLCTCLYYYDVYLLYFPDRFRTMGS